MNLSIIYSSKCRFYFKIRFAVLKLTVLKFCPYLASLIIGFLHFSIFSDAIHRLMMFSCVSGDIVGAVNLQTHSKHDILSTNKRPDAACALAKTHYENGGLPDEKMACRAAAGAASARLKGWRLPALKLLHSLFPSAE